MKRNAKLRKWMEPDDLRRFREANLKRTEEERKTRCFDPPETAIRLECPFDLPPDEAYRRGEVDEFRFMTDGL